LFPSFLLSVTFAIFIFIFSFFLRISFLSLQKQKTVGRTKVLLETVPVHRLADIFVASFEISFEEQLSMLDSVDLKVRLSKATELVDRHLQVKCVNGSRSVSFWN
jgi:MFS superfamily sulfate permease-like transporter